jgi:hypothetical protein
MKLPVVAPEGIVTEIEPALQKNGVIETPFRVTVLVP